MFIRKFLFATSMFTPASLCSIEGEGDNAGGGGGGAGDAPTSVLSTAVAAADDAGDKSGETPADGAGDKNSEGDKGGDKPQETPEEKATREAKEKDDADKKTAETLKSYEALKMPDGLARDHAITTEFLKDAAARGMPADQAQAMIDKVGPSLVEAINKPYNAWADKQKEWVTSLPTDDEFGGANYQANLGICASAIDKIMGKEDAGKFKDMLAFTGAGNNPEMVRFLFRAGKAMKEGSFVGGNNGGANKSLAEKMYG